MMTSNTPTSDPRMEAAQRALESTLPLVTLDTGDEIWERYASNLVTTLNERFEQQTGDLTGSACFVLVERPGQYARRSSAFRVIDIDKDGTVELAGHLFLVGESANGGVAIPFDSQTAMVALLKELDLESRPTATVHLPDRSMRLYPAGVGDVDWQLTTGLSYKKMTFSIDHLIATLDEFHDRCISTPQLTNPIFWENQNDWLPYGFAEKNIQWPLRIALVFAFKPDILVEEEVRGPTGDSDFVFYDAKAIRTAPPLAVVEAKVQKSFRASGPVSPAETAAEYIRGLIQTAAYRQSLAAPHGILVCFDLRKPGEGSDVAWGRARARCDRVIKGLARANRGGPPMVLTWMAFANTKAAQAAQAALGSLYSDDRMYPVTKRPDYATQLSETA